jgi:hypothetical protein
MNLLRGWLRRKLGGGFTQLAQRFLDLLSVYRHMDQDLGCSASPVGSFQASLKVFNAKLSDPTASQSRLPS